MYHKGLSDNGGKEDGSGNDMTMVASINKSQSSINAIKLPPGKTGWPFIGETLEFVKMGRRGVPEKFFHDRMRKFSSEIFKTSIMGESVVVFCGPVGNKFLFSNEAKLITGWVPTAVNKILPFIHESSSSNEITKKMRKVLLGFLGLETLQKFIGAMDSIAKQHLKTHWDDKKEVLVYPLAKSYAMSLACKVFMSVEDPVQIAKFADPFSCLVAGIISLPIDLLGTPLNKSVEASTLIRKDLLEIIRQRKADLTQNKASPKQDTMSHMMLATDAIGQSMEEMDVADNILDPEKFDPTRFEGKGPAPYTYVPFGGGQCMCPGQEYAQLKILVFRNNVVTKFKLEEVLLD
ncbi:hypothetical protein IFM89_025297 [Coptis chinensis]|uniref:Cytochrome P450 n=1 Tax=Coptis chinensis TaxID=261450 RepID=A0A835LEJ2_9MAGN|nr:hypothetical protein IFM89_025297 [Coptis chinensis]